MNLDNPFLKIRTRSILVWFILSIPVLIITILGLTIFSKIASDFYKINLPVNYLHNPLSILIISQVWLYGLMLFWCLDRCRKSQINFQQILGKLPNLQRLFYLLLLFIPLILFSLGSGRFYYAFVNLFFPSVGQEIGQQQIFAGEAETYVPLIYNLIQIFSIVIIAPIVEEILFRGIILQRWSTKWGVRRGIIFSSLAFGVLHFNIIGLFMFGVVMSLLYLKTRTLFIPMIVHALNNFGAIILEIFVSRLGDRMAKSDLEIVSSSNSLGIICLSLSLPLLVIFFYKTWPSKRQTIPYLANLDRINISMN
jgi:hypothetical protein